MYKKTFLLSIVVASTLLMASRCGKDIYGPSSVPGENGSFEKITEEASETLVTPARNYEKNGRNILKWTLAQRLDISRDGNIAYLAIRDGYSNIFVQNIKNRGVSTQRTNSTAVDDVAYSPDGEHICFSKPNSDGTSYLFIINAKQGSQIRQISPSNVYDCQPCYSKDGKFIFFTRIVGGTTDIWSYEIATSNFTMLCNGTCMDFQYI